MKKLLTITLFLILANLSLGQESLKIVWLEKFEWKILSNQEDGNIHVIELIPGKEKAENWTMLGQMLSIKGALNVPMEDAKNMMFEQTKINSPNAKLTVLEKDDDDEYPWIIFKIEQPKNKGNKKTESQLWYIRQGKTSLYVNFIAMKKKKLKKDFVQEWSTIFKESEIVELINGVEEFEGIIKYNHQVVAMDSSYDVNYDYSAIGKSSIYHYKNGNYKFLNQNSYFKADLFKSNELANYLLISNSDTVIYLNARIADLEIMDYSIEESVDTILNYSCDLITLKIKPINQDSPISYRRYYFSKKLPINSNHFKECKGSAYELIYRNTKSLPLRIEFEWPNRKIIWEAAEVENKKLSDDIFRVDEKWILSKGN